MYNQYGVQVSIVDIASLLGVVFLMWLYAKRV